MKIERIRIRRTMRGEDAAAWALALEDPSWLAGASVLKEEPGSSWVRRATLNGREVVVKCRILNTRSRRLKAALGYGHGDKHWRGAAALAAKKIETARPIALARAAVDGTPLDLLVLNFAMGRSLLEEMRLVHDQTAAIPTRKQHELAAIIGQQVFQMAGRSCFNRDHKPSNLIVVRMPDVPPAPVMIDCVGISGNPLRAGWTPASRMLASLVIEPTGCGVTPRLALCMRAVRGLVSLADPKSVSERRAMIRIFWRGAASHVARHGDPRPRINPLSDRGIGFQPMSARRAER